MAGCWQNLDGGAGQDGVADYDEDLLSDEGEYGTDELDGDSELQHHQHQVNDIDIDADAEMDFNDGTPEQIHHIDPRGQPYDVHTGLAYAQDADGMPLSQQQQQQLTHQQQMHLQMQQQQQAQQQQQQMQMANEPPVSVMDGEHRLRLRFREPTLT